MPIYKTGTASVSAGGTALTGVGTLWSPNVKEGDLFQSGGFFGVVETVNSNTSITLASPWPGSALTNAAYTISRTGAGWSSTREFSFDLIKVAEDMKRGRFLRPDDWIEVAADRANFDNRLPGFIIARTDTTPHQYSVKMEAGAVWTDWQYMLAVDGSSAPITVGETFVSSSLASITPDTPDIGPALQSLIDANPGKTIVIPPWNGATLKSVTPVFIDQIGSKIENHAKIVRPAGTLVKDGVFCFRKRTPGTGPKLTDVGLRNRGSFFFEPAQTAVFTATGGQTVFALASAASTKFDFFVVRIRGGVWTVLSQSSDLSAGGPTGFTLAAGATAGDELRVAVVPGSARAGVCPIEGTSTDKIGRVTIEGTLIADGVFYALAEVAYADDVRFGDVIATGGVDRSTVYPYQGGGDLVTGHLKASGIPLAGWGSNFGASGAGIPLCYYGFNVNAGTTFSRIKVGGLTTANLTGHGLGVLGDVRQLLVEGHASQSPGLYHAVLFQGTTGEEDVQVLGFDYEGATSAEPIYILGDNVSMTEGVVRNTTNSVRLNSGSGRRKGNRLQCRIINPTVTNALMVQEQNDPTLDVEITGGPASAATGANLINVTRASGRIKVTDTTGLGEGALLSGVTDSNLTVIATGKQRAALLYNNATDNDVRVYGRGCSLIGVQTLAGSDHNILSGNTRGVPNPNLDGASGTLSSQLKV